MVDTVCLFLLLHNINVIMQHRRRGLAQHTTSETICEETSMKTYEANAYAYDHIGNHTASSVNSATTAYTANALNQYTTFSNLVQSCNPVHDLDGNLLTNGVWSYAYDAENRLIAAYSNNVCVVSNAYDHMSRRVVKWTPCHTTTFVYDGWNLVQETISTASGTTTNHYVWGKDLSGSLQGAGGVGGLLAVWMNETWHFPLYDNNGNITAYIDEQGVVVAEYVYDAYGGTIAASGSTSDTFRHRFSTKYFDTETGLYYYGYRFYDPAMHRWLNRDPVEEEGGFNLYAFCGNDGVNAVDFLGEWALKFKPGFTDAEIEEIKSIFSKLPDIVSMAETRTKQWQLASSELPNCCKVKEKMEKECAFILKTLGKMKDKLNSNDTLTILPKYDPKNDGAVLPPRFVGFPRNRMMLSTHPNGSLRNQDGANWAGVSTTIFHELSHIAGLMNENRWNPKRHLYFEFAQNFDYIATNPSGFFMRGAYYHWWGNLERPASPHYLLWVKAVDAINNKDNDPERSGQ
jgi:RHS repeat-associated protein